MLLRLVPTPAPHVVPQRQWSANTRHGAVGLLAAVALAAAALAGCGGGNNLFAPNPAYNVDTQETVFQVSPLSTATASAYSAVNISALTVVRPALTTDPATGALAPNFNFAVDRGADGRVRLLPSRLVVGLGGVGRPLQTGFQTVTTAFEALDAAPGGTYQADSATTVGVGQTVVVEAQSLACRSTRPNVYAKLVVDSVAAGTGLVYLRARVDPNCGFRSLKAGKPTS